MRVLPLACVEAGTLPRANPRAALLLALCDYIYGTGPRARYCDGLPLAVSPAHGPQFDRNDVIIGGYAQHLHALETCFEQRNEWSDILPLEHDLLFWVQDLPTDLPERVLAFVARMRREHMWMRHHPQYDRFFTTCQRKGCTRALIVPPKPKMAKPPARGAATNTVAALRDGQRDAQRASAPAQHELLLRGLLPRGGPRVPRHGGHARRRRGGRVLPRAGRTSGAAPGTVIVGPCKTVKLYEAALLRNARLDRRISKGLGGAAHAPLPALRGRRRGDAAAGHRCRQRRPRRALRRRHHGQPLGELPAGALPSTTDWRNRVNAYRSVVTRVRGIYKQYADSNSVCTGGNTRWMGRVRRRAQTCLRV